MLEVMKATCVRDKMRVFRLMNLKHNQHAGFLMRIMNKHSDYSVPAKAVADTLNAVHTANIVNTADTANTVNTANSVNTANPVNTANSASKANASNIVNTPSKTESNIFSNVPRVKRFIAALCVLGALPALSACGDNFPTAQDLRSQAQGAGLTQQDLAPHTDLSGEFSGAGASSQQAVMESWIAGFQASNTDIAIGYDPSGSGAGVNTFLMGASAWAGSDAVLSDEQLAQSSSVCAVGQAFDVPVMISPIAVIVNLPGVVGQDQHIVMDADTLAAVFNGTITRWNDRRLQALNPQLNLPDLPVTVVHRSDKSGTTLNFVSYLKDAAADQWQYDLSENWPNNVGQGAKGTSGVVATVQQAAGTIGYADYSQIGKLATVALSVNSSQPPVAVSVEGATKALEDSHIDQKRSQNNRVIVQANHTTDKPGAYPIVLVSYAIACTQYSNASTTQFMRVWLDYITSERGQALASRNAGTAPLPHNLRERVAQSVQAIEAPAAPASPAVPDLPDASNNQSTSKL